MRECVEGERNVEVEDPWRAAPFPRHNPPVPSLRHVAPQPSLAYLTQMAGQVGADYSGLTFRPRFRVRVVL